MQTTKISYAIFGQIASFEHVRIDLASVALFMEKLFGTDGIRGHAGEFPLDRNTVATIGRSLARKYREILGRPPKFVTGRDTRESGPWIESMLHGSAGAEGAVCESAGVITTPGVAFLAGHFGFDAGIVISASHNPFADNGIKVFSPDGKKISEDIENAVESDIRKAAAEAEEASQADEIAEGRVDEFRTAYF